MKKLNDLKLSKLSYTALSEKEQNLILGGTGYDCCGCGCNGSSNTTDNKNANSGSGYGQSGGGNDVCIFWNDSNNNGIFDTNEYEAVFTC